MSNTPKGSRDNSTLRSSKTEDTPRNGRDNYKVSTDGGTNGAGIIPMAGGSQDKSKGQVIPQSPASFFEN